MYPGFSTDKAFLRRFQKWIHVKLPTKEQIEVILGKKLEKHDNSLLKYQIRNLSSQMNGYSPFDIDKILDQIFEEKYEELLKATTFTKDHNGFYNMCKATHHQAIQISFETVRDHQYNFPTICFKDIQKALHKVKPTNKLADDNQFVEFVKDNF